MAVLVLHMAAAAYLVARKTLGSMSRGNQALAELDLPQDVDLQGPHQLVAADVGEDARRSDDGGVGEEDVQAAVSLQGIVDDRLHLAIIGSIELARVDVDGRVERLDLPLVRLQMLVVVVTEVDGSGAIQSELMGGGSTDAQRRVGAWGETINMRCPWL